MKGSLDGSGFDSTRRVMLTICKSFDPVRDCQRKKRRHTCGRCVVGTMRTQIGEVYGGSIGNRTIDQTVVYCASDK